MSQKTVISKVKELDATGGETLYFPQNQILYVDQLTGYAPDTRDERKVFSPHSREDVYDYYKPSKERVSIYNEEGELFYEDFHFGCVDDFDDDKLIEQSQTMSLCEAKMEESQNIIQQLQRNRALRSLLNNKEQKEAMIACLKHLRNELNN